MARQVPYVYTIDFAAIAASGSQVKNVLIEADADFVIERMRAVFWNDALAGTSIARTPLGTLGDMSPPATVGNTWYNHYQLTVKLGDSSTQWLKAATYLPLVFDVGDVDRPAILQRKVKAGDTIFADVTSYAGVAVSGQLAFIGFKEYRA